MEDGCEAFAAIRGIRPCRELFEELGVASTIGAELVVTEHAYPERTVRLHFRRCEIAGEPQPMLGQELRWVTRAELAVADLPEADRELVRVLTRAPGSAAG